MATLNGVNYAQTHAPSDGNWKLVPVSEVGGQLRLIYDTFSCVTATAAADVLNVGRLPKDARVWDVHVTTSVTLGSGTKVNVGIAYDDSALTSDADLFLKEAATAGVVNRGMLGGLGIGAVISGVHATIPQVPITTLGEGKVQLTFVDDPADGAVVKVFVLYTID